LKLFNFEGVSRMTGEEALVFLNTFLEKKYLNGVQKLVFLRSWEGETYLNIAQSSDYDTDYIKYVGFKLFRLLSNIFGEKITKSNLRLVLRRRLEQTQVAAKVLAVVPETEDININNQNTQTISLEIEPNFENAKVVNAYCQEDWGEAIDVSAFYGRTKELTTLKQWIVEERCRLVALLGIGGIGKTALSVKLAEQIKDEFEYLIWRSIQNATPIEDILVTLIQFFSNQNQIDLLESVNAKIARLINYLRKYRCLVVIDNTEAVLRSGDYAGQYLEGYESYGELLRKVGEIHHQSCFIVTSREKPKEILLLEGEKLPVRALELTGLPPVEGRKIFEAKGSFSGLEKDWRILIEHYAGNPLALKMVAATIQHLFNGNISKYVELLKKRALVFDDIRTLLEEQFNRLSDLEKEVMYWLAINREAVSFSELQEDILSVVSKKELPNSLRSLVQRSLIEQKIAAFTQQPVVLDYMTNRFIQEICKEIKTGTISMLNNYALIKAQTKDYIRSTQINFILKPIVNQLISGFGNQTVLENHLAMILSKLRGKTRLQPGYAGGNILNLFCQMKTNLSNSDFSFLTIWQAFLQGLDLHYVNFAHSDLAKSVFSEILGSVVSLAFSSNGNLLATAGDANGQICVWQAMDGKQLFTCKGHAKYVLSVAFSPDGHILASGSEDQTVRLWDVSTGQCLKVLQGHTSWVCSVAFSPDGHILASGSSLSRKNRWIKAFELNACI
jgi:hypothetical protein